MAAVAWRLVLRTRYNRGLKLQINGEERSVSIEPASLAGLLDHLGLKVDRVAVELNREIVPRDRWPATLLADGDKLEIVHFVGGGALQLATRH